MLETFCRNSVDWSATGDMMSGLGTLAGVFAVIYAANVGKSTFAVWKAQKIGERQLHLAEDILTLSYRLNRAFETIRWPVLIGFEAGEAQTALRNSGVIKENTPTFAIPMLANAQAALTRTATYKADFERVLEIYPSAKAIFGNDIAHAIDTYWQLRRRLIVAAQSYSMLSLSRHSDPERLEHYERIIWSSEAADGDTDDGSDAFSLEIKAVTELMESYLLPIIRASPAKPERR